MAINQETIQEIREKLLAEKLQLEEEIGRIATPTGTPGEYETRFEDLGREEGDSIVETEQYVDNIAVENTLTQKLQDIIEALQRIDGETYGKCTVCGEYIALERLQVYPSAKTCVHHAETK